MPTCAQYRGHRSLTHAGSPGSGHRPSAVATRCWTSQIATVRNSETANFGLDANNAGPGGPQTNGGYNENPIPGHSQSGVYAAIQHVF